MSGWQPVSGYEGRYLVSDDGDVATVFGNPINPWLSDHGYKLVRLSGPRALKRVHRLVAEAFVSNPDALPFVNHINNDRADNRASNLEWCTQAENLAHMTAQGRRSSHWQGKRSPNARLSDEQVSAIRNAAGTASHADLAGRFGCSKRTIGKIIRSQSYASLVIA